MRNFFALIVLVFAYVTNPTLHEFSRFLKNNAEAANRNGANPLISAFTGEIMSSAVQQSTVRKGYFLFSTYDIDTSLFRIFLPDLPQRIIFFGAFGRFFRI